MFGISELLSIGGIGYTLSSGIITGKKLSRIEKILNDNSSKLEKLSDEIFIRKDEFAFHNLNGKNIKPNLRLTREFLEPLPKIFNNKILSSAVITSSEKLQKAFKTNPFNVLDFIKPIQYSKRHPNPEMVPIMFYDNNTAYIGWQTKGILPLLFDFELNPNSGLWQNDDIFKNNKTKLGENVGIETQNNNFHIIAKKGIELPYTYKEVFSTAIDNQTSIEVHILQGKFLDTNLNKSLGRFHLENIPPQKKGVPQIEISFSFDEKAVITVSAKDLMNNNIKSHKFYGELLINNISRNKEIFECVKCGNIMNIPTNKHFKFKCKKCNYEYEVNDLIIH